MNTVKNSELNFFIKGQREMNRERYFTIVRQKVEAQTQAYFVYFSDDLKGYLVKSLTRSLQYRFS